MKLNLRFPVRPALLASLLMGAASLVHAGPISAQLSGASEVPANGSTAKGTLEGNFDPATRMLSWNVTYSGLTGNVTGAHFHGPAMAGSNAGVVVPFKDSMASPIKGSATLSPEQAADLQGGKWYVNLHTAAHPGGEIRGQVMVAP